MNEEKLQRLLKDKQIIKKSPDIERAKSLIKSAENTAETQLQNILMEKSATSIFREIYEAMRQLGDALWWIQGYEAQTHDASIDIIKTADFLNAGQKVKALSLDRLKTIRYDANYRGFQISISQAQEIIEAWNIIGKAICFHLKKKLSL